MKQEPYIKKSWGGATNVLIRIRVHPSYPCESVFVFVGLAGEVAARDFVAVQIAEHGGGDVLWAEKLP